MSRRNPRHVGPGRLAGSLSLEAQATRLLQAAERKERREKAKAAIEAAEEKLTEAEVKELLMPSREHIEALRRLASGLPPDGKERQPGKDAMRHSAVIMQALKIMLEHTVAPAKKEEGQSGAVQVVVNTLPAKVEKFQAPAEATLTQKPEEPN